eukprot:2894224-Pyramimonas_sp.AAC.1
MTGVDSQTSDTSACRIQRSELALILELEVLPIYARTRAVEELYRARTEDNPEASGAFGCCIERKLYESLGGKKG